MNRLSYHIDGRLFEWAMSIPVVMVSLMLFVWPQIAEAPAFHLFANLVPVKIIGIVLLICGVTCIVALLVNGASMVLGPRVRAWAALIRSMLWLQFFISTLQAGIEQGYPYTVTPFWITFALAEVWVAYRAVLDVRSPH